MIQGLYAAASGMVAIEAQQATVANNIANAATAGFKRQSAVQEGFYTYFQNSLKNPFHFDVVTAPGGGSKVVETFSDTSAGVLTETGNTLNVALQGPGYLAVDTPQGERFTRSGDFGIDIDGHLATPDGYKVQSLAGAPLDVSGGAVVIDRDGGVKVNGVAVGQLRLVEFEDPHMLNREGSTLYAASEAALERSSEAADTQVIQSYLESSNVQVAQEMVNMIMGLRAYASNQKVINTVDETMSRLIEQVGSPL